MRSSASKDDLRTIANKYQQQLVLMRLAATAIMNHLVKWDGDIGTCEFYMIRITRRTVMDLPCVTEVEEIKEG